MEQDSSLFEKFVRIYKKNELIFEEAAEGHEMFVIMAGEVKLLKKSKTGNRLLKKLKAGEFFGEMAIIDDSPRSASAIAEVNDTKLIVLDKQKFTYLVQQIPHFSFTIMEKLAQRLREANQKRVGK